MITRGLSTRITFPGAPLSSKPWRTSWKLSAWKGPIWSPVSGCSIGTMPQYTPPRKFSGSGQKRRSRWFPTPLTHLTWPRQITFYSPHWRGNWRGSPWPWACSRISGRGSSENWRLRQSLQEVATPLRKVGSFRRWIRRRKLGNIFFDNLYRFCFICLVYFVPECTPYKGTEDEYQIKIGMMSLEPKPRNEN